MKNIKVSIVIVCMNNLKNLYPCLESIQRYTHVSYETFVVAYLFTPENLQRVKNDFPWVSFIESNEIRGFSENNNLALRQARGKYCFVLNDDTEIKTDVLGGLVETIEQLPEEAAIISPVTVFANGQVQCCGRGYANWKTFLKGCWGIKSHDSKYVDQDGVFQTYNILGAAFLIKTEVLHKEGYFDERYFFCPEDLELSDRLNRRGYKCYVNSNIRVIHYEGMSGKSLLMVQTCTKPAGVKGGLIFYSRGNKMLMFFLALNYAAASLLRFMYHRLKSIRSPRPNQDYILSIGDINVMCTIFTSMTPKEIFVKFYKRLKK